MSGDVKTCVNQLTGISVQAGNAAQFPQLPDVEDDNKSYVDVQHYWVSPKRGTLLEWVIIFYAVKTLSNSDKTPCYKNTHRAGMYPVCTTTFD